MELNTFKDNAAYSSVQTQISKQLEALAGDPLNNLAKLSDQDTTILESSEMHDLLARHSLAIAQLLTKMDGGALKLDPDNPDNSIEPRAAAESLIQHQTRANCLFRHVEKFKFNNLLQSGDRAVDLHLIHDIEVNGDVDEVRDSLVRNLMDFSGDSSSNPEVVEDELCLFLERYVSAVKSSRINAPSAVGLLYCKLCGSALQLVKDFLSVQNVDDDDTRKVRLMIHCLESRFLVSANPVLANARLSSIQKGNLSYVQLQTKISKLARYAVLNEPRDKQLEIQQVKGLAQFRLAISEADRQLLIEEDEARLKAYLKPLTLQGSSAYLDAYHNKKRAYQMVANNDTNIEYNFNTIKTKQKGGKIEQKGESHSKEVAVSHNVNRQPVKQHFQKNSREVKRPSFPQKKRDNPNFVHPADLGFFNNECLLCGRVGHRFSSCPLYPQPSRIFKSLCSRCFLGAHGSKLCKQSSTNNKPFDKRVDTSKPPPRLYPKFHTGPKN